MSFFCAGSSNEVKRRVKSSGSKPVPNSKSGSGSNSGSGSTAIVSSNGRVVNPFADDTKKVGPISVPHSDSDLRNSRKMVVLQEYRPVDNRGLAVRRGESVQVISQDHSWLFVRNERKEEGYVPCSHLVAPYSTTRSRKALGGSNPLRPVASGSSIEIKDPPHHSVPMYPSTSAGKVKPYSYQDETRMNGVPPPRRGFSPHELANNNTNSLSQGQNGVSVVTSYDQKYSPSTSSGVASLTGTGSPVGHSDGSNHSSFCSIEEERVGKSNGTPEEVGRAPVHNSVQDDVNEPQMRGRVGAADSSYMKANRPLPPHPPHSHHHYGVNTEGLPLHEQQNVHNFVPNEAPPLPPRTPYYNYIPQMQSTSQDEPPYHEEYPPMVDSSDPYASPADAIPCQQNPHLGQPRGRSLTDVRLREVRLAQENGDYSEVFQGHQRPTHHRPNGYRLTDENSSHSEGGSSQSRSSRRSGSRVSSLRTQTTEPYCESRERVSYESDITPNGNWEHAPPISVNTFAQQGMTKIKKFRKNLWGVYVVMQGFEAYDENEVTVREGDHVSVWNQDDPEWYWIVKHDTSEEGFIPSSYLKEINSDNIQLQGSETNSHHHQYHSDQPRGHEKAPPLPPKPQYSVQNPPRVPNTAGYDNHALARHNRERDEEVRSSSTVPPQHRGVAGGQRGRLSSDSSIQRSKIHRNDRSLSPPNTPPPPYTEFDQSYHHGGLVPPGPPRHFSLSQQSDSAQPQPNFTRTRSHGQMKYRRVNIPRPQAPPSGETNGQRAEAISNPNDVFTLTSPADGSGGTLV